ncbi:hypothetical protein PVK06_042900 [Gossypium arboreum]|uniref:Uncharacterized protein n=1 Tax=Gossypium arboreum TaxID=29729 RepID=A0ABR0MM31_GOSAR|nr:hypothetical protein PVK06_042900 [Gossypium arboreum]
MINHIRQRESIHVYVEHKVDTPDVVDDTMLLPGSRENDVNSGVGVGEQNCNERVNGGDRETFTELGGESNVRSDFIESSDACENSEREEKNGEVSSDEGIEYVDSLDLGSHGSDSDGEGLMEEIFELLPRGTPPPTRVPLAAPTPPTAITHTSPAPFDPAPPAPSQTIASEASTSSPPAL